MREAIPFTKREEQEIGEKLDRNLGPEYVSTRTGPSGRLTYVEGKTAINIANEIFGFNGWTSEIKETTVDFIDTNEQGRISTGISVTLRVTLKDGSFHEDIGYGSSENARTKAAAFEKARKQAVTDATKRALRNFGNALGNCLYDKSYVNNIGKMAQPQIKFTPQNLYRHPQFDTKRKQQEQLEEQQSKIRRITDQERHQQQITMQSQRLSQNGSTSTSNDNKKLKSEAVPPIVKTESSSTPLSPIVPKTKPVVVKVESKTADLVETKNIRAEFIPPLLMPEDSFSYEGDDEFFVQMLANNDFDPEAGAVFISQ